MLFTAAAAAALFASSAVRAEVVKLHADLNARQEVPPNNSTATGVFNGTLDTSAKKLTYDLTYTGLSGPATMAHIHGPAGPSANAPILFPFPNPASPAVGTADVNEATVRAIMDGKAYVNVHTAAHPGGEIRGQIEVTKQ